MRSIAVAAFAACVTTAAVAAPALIAPREAHAASGGVGPSLYAGLHWRSIGPFRGGRTVAVAGVPGDGRTFYTGAVGGGVWKTENAGRTWRPVTDALPVASIGALAVAPGAPQIVYAGSGEADMRSDIIHGNGMYRSDDAGATWTHIGLDDSRQIGRIVVSPSDSRVLLVAALGHAYGPNPMRGVYRSTDGGTNWTRTLFRDENTGAIDLAADPSMTTVYASLWQTRRPPWSVYPPSNGPGTSLWKSTDGGVTWKQITGGGFPSEGLGKIGLAVAPSSSSRVYAIVDAKDGGLYRSDDAGATWTRVSKDQRLWQRGWYFCHVVVDPANPDVVYVSDTSVYRSTDGGVTFTALKGSPDGDDFHQLWIDPQSSHHLVLASDQGTTVSVDGGVSWSSWFNQPTGQFYHVAVDDAFPYHLAGAQQDSGAALIVSRSSGRGIDERDWQPIAAGGESGSLAFAPGDAQHVFGRAGDGVQRQDLHTAQIRAFTPVLGHPGVWRSEWTMPLAFAVDGTLYTSYQNVWRSDDRGANWTPISGDLSNPQAGVPATLDAVTAADANAGAPRGLVYALATSPRNARVVWAGTDDGLVYRSVDAGRTWRNVTPPGTVAWSHIDTIEASHVDDRTAYVAIDLHRLDDDRPVVAVTHDGGTSWRQAGSGLPPGNVNVVREDPQRPGLLYAGTENGVAVSFDDGRHWQSLQLNLPATSVRDIAVHGDDLAIATHGRAFWILDDVTPLRALARDPSNAARLFAPAVAVRVAPYADLGEALPPETPRGENPPYGALLDYVVPAGAGGAVTLAVADAHGTVLRRWSSTDPATATDPSSVPYPAYWIAKPVVPSAAPGMHRFVWDLSAAPGDGAPLVPPGRYTVLLSEAGRHLSAALTVARDPRVHASDADFAAQYALARAAFMLGARASSAVAVAAQLRLKPGAKRALIDAVAGAPPHDGPDDSVGKPLTRFTTLRYLAAQLASLTASVESADGAPTRDEVAAWNRLRPQTERALRAFAALSR